MPTKKSQTQSGFELPGRYESGLRRKGPSGRWRSDLPGAVLSSQIFQDQVPVFPADAGVHPGDIGLFEPNVAILVPADDDHIIPAPEPLPVILPGQCSKGRVSHQQARFQHAYAYGPTAKLDNLAKSPQASHCEEWSDEAIPNNHLLVKGGIASPDGFVDFLRVRQTLFSRESEPASTPDFLLLIGTSVYSFENQFFLGESFTMLPLALQIL
jgi:hypothetical protein